MGQVAFWSNRHGQTGNTANMIAVSMLIGIEYLTKILISHTHWEMSTLESTLLKERKLHYGFNQNYTNIGMDALERLAKSNRLDPTNVKDYAIPILRDRLDLIVGTSKPYEEMYVAVNGVLGSILNAAKSYYDISFIDVNSGTKNILTNSVLSTSDLVVVNLNQNINVLNEFFNETPDCLTDKKYLIVLGQYDGHSKYTAANIQRMFKCEVPIFTIPHSAGFMDACNDKSVVEFFLRNKNVRTNHDNNLFMVEVRKLAKGIMEAVDIDTRIFSEKGA
ncbi:chromosome partitioning protein ParA [Paenibacillus sp. FA6]|uniref:chromosome partitioning protein ParA n=1 Tax=Paenibacillus sp. FA6 TaxID=3413029 RepID=UPI003F6598E3